MKSEDDKNAATCDGDTVVVVGGGVIGVACASYLVKAGYRVRIIDRSTIGGACSLGNLGYVCPSHALPLTEPGALAAGLKSFVQPRAPFRIKPRLDRAFWQWLWQFARRCNQRDMLAAGAQLKVILDASLAEYEQLIPTLPADCEWQKSGLLYVFESDAGRRAFLETEEILAANFGIHANAIAGDALPSFDPALKEGLAGGLHYEGDASLRPERLCALWLEQLRSGGAAVSEHCELRDITRSDSGIASLQTSLGTLQADHYVFATGAWSPTLAPLLACRIPVEPGKGYSLTVDRPRRCPRYPMLFPEHRVGVAPFKDGFRLGSMMELVGYDTSIPQHRMVQLRQSAEPYLVEPHTPATQAKWYGWRPMTWDSLPIIGRSPRLDNAYLATGHNMLGMSLATGTGRLIAEIIGGKTPYIDAKPYSPDRFQRDS